MLYHYALVVISFLGLFNALILYWQHINIQKRPMVCLFGQQCEIVVESRFGHALGIKNELIGIIFYIIIISLSLWHISGSDFTKINQLIFFLTLVAGIASTYLLTIQFGLLKNYCSWCIFSALINYLILITSVFIIL